MLFSRFSLSNKKYTEPSDVLRALVDDFGNPLSLGDQKDIGEFNLNFLERLEEGLGERVIKSVEDKIGQKDHLNNSLSVSTLDIDDNSSNDSSSMK